MEIAVAELIVRFMERLGIRNVYGMPGSHILPVYDHLYDSPIRTVLAKRSEEHTSELQSNPASRMPSSA
jgi:acetolactate synthase-1/2/3 large subunit